LDYEVVDGEHFRYVFFQQVACESEKSRLAVQKPLAVHRREEVLNGVGGVAVVGMVYAEMIVGIEYLISEGSLIAVHDSLSNNIGFHKDNLQIITDNRPKQIPDAAVKTFPRNYI
jgi:hypothetical protein